MKLVTECSEKTELRPLTPELMFAKLLMLKKGAWQGRELGSMVVAIVSAEFGIF